MVGPSVTMLGYHVELIAVVVIKVVVLNISCTRHSGTRIVFVMPTVL